MPQPVLQDVHVSAALTNVSVAYLQEQDAYIADQVFPMVPVEHQTDQYFVWNKDDFFRDEAQLRADAVESAGSGYKLTTQKYTAEVYALHKDIGPQVRANADPAIDLDVTTTRVLMQKMLIKRDRIFAQKFMTTGLWTGTSTGSDIVGTAGGTPGSGTPAYWNDDANGDPFTDIETQQTAILQATGHMPNRLVLAWPVYQALRKHPLVIDRIKYTSQPDAKSVTPAMLAAMFDVDKCIVAKAVYNSAAEGLAGVYNFIVGKNALLCHAADEPGLMIASAGYTFGWSGFTGLNTLGVRAAQIPMNWLGVGTIRDEVEMAFDMEVVGATLGAFFSGIVQ
jgi:hypothetical protein